MGKGILLVAFDFTRAHEDEFHDWYDLEHIPERERVPGFGDCTRWISVENPKVAIASYELDSLSVLETPAYRAIGGDNLSVWSKRMIGICERLLRFEGEKFGAGAAEAPRGAGGLLVNAMNVAPEHEAEFNEWYDSEHIPALSAVPGALAARRFRSAGSPRYLAIYHLQSPEVAASAAWQTAANTPWTERIRHHFRDRLRILCHAYRRSG